MEETGALRWQLHQQTTPPPPNRLENSCFWVGCVCVSQMVVNDHSQSLWVVGQLRDKTALKHSCLAENKNTHTELNPICSPELYYTLYSHFNVTLRLCEPTFSQLETIQKETKLRMISASNLLYVLLFASFTADVCYLWDSFHFAGGFLWVKWQHKCRNEGLKEEPEV